MGCLTPAFWGAHKWAEMLPHPCILGDPQTKGNKIRMGCLTLAFWGAHKWAEMLRHPCILGDPQTKGNKIRIACLTPASGRKCCITPAFSGIPKQRGTKHNWLPKPCFLGSPQVGGNATSPLHSRGSPDKGGQNQNGLPNPCLLGAHKWAEMLPHPCILGDPQTKGNKIRIGCLTLAFWVPTSGRKCYATLAFSGIPKQRGTKSERPA